MNTATASASARFERLLALSPAVHYIAEPTAPFAAVFLSAGVEGQTGYTPAQFTGDPAFWAGHIHPEDRSGVLSAMDGISESGTQVHEYRFRFADGSWHWMHDQMTLVRDDDGEPLEIVGSWLDITERRKTEEGLRERDRQMRAFFRSSGIDMVAKDAEGRYVETSRRFEQIFRLNEGEAVGKLPQDIFSAPYADHVREQDLKVLKGARIVEQEDVLPGDDAPVTLLINKFPITDESGEITGIGAIGIDVSERRKVEKALREAHDDLEHRVEDRTRTLMDEIADRRRAEAALTESERQLRLITDHLPITIVYVDRDLRFRFVNRTAEAWYARGKEEILGNSQAEVLGEGTINRLRPHVDRALGGEQQSFDIRITYPDGVTRDVNQIYIPQHDEDGTVAGFYAMAIDITERKRSEEALRQSESRLRLIADGLPVLIIHLDQYCIYRFANKIATEWYARPYDEIIGRHYREIQTPETVREYAADIKATLNGKRVSSQKRVTYPDGKTRDVEVTLLPEISGDNKVTGFFAMVLDVTEREQREAALRESEQQVRLIANNLPITIVYLDSELRYRFVNDTCAAWFARPPRDIIGRRASEILGEEMAVKLQPHSLEALAGESRSFDERISYPDGKTRDVTVAYALHRDARGNLLGCFRMVMDISERKRSEEALKRSEERLRLIADGLPVLIVYVGTDLVYRFANKTAVAWYARPRSEIVGRHTREIHSAETVEKLRPAIQAVLRAERAHVQRRITYPDGKTRDVDTTLVPDVAADGTLRGYYSMVLDITERIRAEESLKSSERQLRLVSDHLPILIIYIDASLRYRFVNKTAEDWLGSPAGALLGKKGSDILGERVTRIFEPHVKAVMQGEMQRFDARIEYPTGVTRDVDVTYVPNLDPDGKTVGYFVMAVDITERKQTEGRLYRYQDQLRALASEISLVEQRERQRIATELHDRTIQTLGLTRIKLGALRASSLSPNAVPRVEEVVSLIDNIIQDTRRLLFELSPPVLYELDFMAALEWLADQSEQRYDFACAVHDDGCPQALPRDLEVMLFQSVRELLANAGKHGKAHEVQVHVIGEDGRIRICVEDDGAGFLDGHRDEASRSPGEGGFGLFNMRERLSMLGGGLEIESRPGGGARVTLTVPL